MARVTVETEFQWECSQCLQINSVRYCPEPGSFLKACSCGHRDRCGDIIESAAPERPRRKTVKRDGK